MKNAEHLYSKPKKSTKKGYIQVGDHKVFYRYVKRGDNLKNVVVVHGGPGANLSSEHPRYFSPEKYNVIQFDHRCCGNSKNENEDMLHDVGVRQIAEDIEQIRQELKLDKIILFGISWGGTLALAYAGLYPQNVESAVMLNPLILEDFNRAWLFSEGGALSLNPDLKPYFTSVMRPEFATEVIKNRCRRSIQDWVNFEAMLSGKPLVEEINPYFERRAMLAVQYFYLDKFLQESFKSVLTNIKAPVISLHGADDMAVSPQTIEVLNNLLPSFSALVFPGLGHSAVNSIAWNKIITELFDLD